MKHSLNFSILYVILCPCCDSVKSSFPFPEMDSVFQATMLLFQTTYRKLTRILANFCLYLGGWGSGAVFPGRFCPNMSSRPLESSVVKELSNWMKKNKRAVSFGVCDLKVMPCASYQDYNIFNYACLQCQCG